MSSAYITEYQGTGLQPNQSIQSPMEPPLVATQKVTFTGTAGTSATLNAKTQLVRINCDGICSYLFSTAGTAATVSDARLSLGVTEYHSVPKGSNLKISFITNS